MHWRVLGLLFLAYVLTARGFVEVTDTSFSLQTAEAIVTRRALDIPRADATFTTPDGRSYSKYGIGLALVFVPAVAVAHAAAHVAHMGEPELAGFLVSFVNVPFALLLVWTFMRLLRRFGVEETRVALLGIALGLGTIAWRYAVSDFSEELQGALLLLAYERATLGSERGAAQGGLAMAGLIVVKLVHLALFPAMLAYLVWRESGPLVRRLRPAVIFAVPVGLALLGILALNAVRFGNPLESGYGHEAQSFHVEQMWWTLPALVGSLNKGMLVFSPVLVLGVLGWPAFARRRRHEAALAGALVLIVLLVTSAWHSWVGGWSWGPRLLVPTMSLWLLPAGFWLEETSRRRFVLAAAITGASIVLQLPSALTRDHEVHHIWQDELGDDERGQMVNEPESASIILFHKLRGRDEVYRARDFGVDSDRTMDLERFATFRGYGIWLDQAALRFHKRWLGWLAAAGLVAAAAWLVRLALDLVRRGGTEPERAELTVATDAS